MRIHHPGVKGETRPLLAGYTSDRWRETVTLSEI